MRGSRFPSPALIVATVALVLALSGAAVALPDKNTVDSGDIERGAVGSKELKRSAVRGPDVQKDALKGRQVFEQKLEPVPEAETVQTVRVFGDVVRRLLATDGASYTAALAAAEPAALATNGDLTVYAKCVRDAGADQLYGVIFAATESPGAIVDSPVDSLPGGDLAADFLNPGTAETARELAVATVTGTGTAFAAGSGDGFRVIGADGSVLAGVEAVAVKNGELASGDGAYGDGNVCLFGGAAIG